MTRQPAILATAILLVSGAAFAQQQYDSLGSPTPAPNQSASPNATPPNKPVSVPSGAAASDKVGTDGSKATTGSAVRPPPSSDGGMNAPADDGRTPSGLAPD
jgi:hypothetical protein